MIVPHSRVWPGLLALAWLASPPAGSAQPIHVTTAGDAVKIRAPRFSFLKGPPLDRLKDGRSVRVELAALILPAPGKAPVAAARRTFALSYDLWEERFAVATVEPRSLTISHLTAPAAEAWCVEQLAIPVRSLGALGRDAAFWVRLESRILDAESAAGADDGSGLTLQALIDALSRRGRTESLSDTLEAGPFRLPR
jgi:hypothetical protein